MMSTASHVLALCLFFAFVPEAHTLKSAETMQIETERQIPHWTIQLLEGSPKWDGKVFGAPTYSIDLRKYVSLFTVPEGKETLSIPEIEDEFAEALGSVHLHIVDWWKLPWLLPFSTEGQVFWPQSTRDKCTICKQLIAPIAQFGAMFGRFAPMLTDGSPNLFEQNMAEGMQIEWMIKRCPTYLSDMCYRPDGFGFTLMSPCPDSIICSTCLGIPPQYCLKNLGAIDNVN